ncbi:MAG: PilT/PilU family type 4a pilus ATPase [Planctomycetota bacterium]
MVGRIEEILASAVERNASDIHINVGLAPIVRINTELLEMQCPVVTQDEAEEIVKEMTSQQRFNTLLTERDLDFSVTGRNGTRFRVNAHFQRETLALSFRAIADTVPSPQELHLPEIVSRLAELPRGLVLVTGHTGSGKSTTLASMIGQINQRHRRHVITLEDPIEYLIRNDHSIIEQREIGSDCPNFPSGLRHALRQDPDIILVGEMRDLETTGATITAAETGHLVLSTLHTINASQTIERIIDIYPTGQQNQIRTMLANTLCAVISQTLFKRADQPGMVPCAEILLCTPAVKNCIRENRIFEIPNIIDTARRQGMQSMDFSIADVFSKGYIDRQDAIAYAVDPARMEKTLQRAPLTAVAV